MVASIYLYVYWTVLSYLLGVKGVIFRLERWGMDVDKVLYVILAILIMILPFSNLLLSQLFPTFPVSNEGGNITDAILAATAVALLCYTRITKELYKTTFDSNRLNSFSGLFVDK